MTLVRIPGRSRTSFFVDSRHFNTFRLELFI
nr:MAG TPA: hypothetical protein [Caudoviricetes sp.]